MGQGAVRSQMDVRICFRVRERKDVDLILGQGMLTAGWHAHTLNAPGKFLISAPEHDTPRRARAYLLTDQAVADTASRYADLRPALDDDLGRRAERAQDDAQETQTTPGPGHDPAELAATQRTRQADPDALLWAALCSRARRGRLRRRPDDRDRHEPPVGLLPAPRPRRRRPGHPGQPAAAGAPPARTVTPVTVDRRMCTCTPRARLHV